MTLTRRGSAVTPLLAFALLASLSGCTSDPADTPTTRSAPSVPVRPAAKAPADTSRIADVSRVKALIGFDEYEGEYEYADSADQGEGEGDDVADPNVWAGAADLSQPLGNVDAAWVPGPYRFSVVCLGGGRVRVTVGTHPKTEWSAPCNGTVSTRQADTTGRAMELHLTGEAGAVGPVAYRADRLAPAPGA